MATPIEDALKLKPTFTGTITTLIEPPSGFTMPQYAGEEVHLWDPSTGSYGIWVAIDMGGYFDWRFKEGMRFAGTPGNPGSANPPHGRGEYFVRGNELWFSPGGTSWIQLG